MKSRSEMRHGVVGERIGEGGRKGREGGREERMGRKRRE